MVYIAQVLKRNRTLKVLNLSENKIEVAGLVALAEALVGCIAEERAEGLQVHSLTCARLATEIQCHPRDARYEPKSVLWTRNRRGTCLILAQTWGGLMGLAC